MVAKSRGTDGSLLASLPWSIAALCAALAAHFAYLPVWISAAFLACGLLRYTIERWRRHLLPAWFRAALALSCFLGILASYGTISGAGPGSALLAIMAALKLLETHTRRDQFVLLFISLFLVMAALLRDQQLWSGPYLLIAIVVIMTAWLRLSAPAQTPRRRSFATSVRLLAYAAPIAVAMWVLFPRLASPFWAVPIDTSRGSMGIGDSISPGDISSLSASNAVAFRVRFNSPIPAARELYWRGLVLQNFDGRKWSSMGPLVDPAAQEQIRYDGAAVDYEITLEPTSQRWVFALDLPERWDLSGTNMDRQLGLSRHQPIDQRVAYRVRSYTRFTVDANGDKLYRNWYQRLPERGNERSRQFAIDMRAQAGSDRAFIDAVLSKFRDEEYFYTLQPPALGNNPVDRFLFDTRAGFCEHYASAFAYLMRAAGVPARIVLGYQGGEANPLGEHFVVRQSDAHAWTEVWLDQQGWIRIDPTAAVAPERVEIGRSAALLDGIGAAWGFTSTTALRYQLETIADLAAAKWDEWVLAYGPENQQRLMNWLGMKEPSWRKMLLTLLLVVLLLVGLISFLLYQRYKPAPVDEALQLYRRFVKKTAVTPAAGETPLAFAARAVQQAALPEEEVLAITHNYLRLRYGLSHSGAMDALRQQIRRFAVAR